MAQYQNSMTGQTVNVNPGGQLPSGPGMWQSSIGNPMQGGQRTPMPTFPQPSASQGQTFNYLAGVSDSLPAYKPAGSGYYSGGRTVPYALGKFLAGVVCIVGVLCAGTAYRNQEMRARALQERRSEAAWNAAMNSPKAKKAGHDAWVRGKATRAKMRAQGVHVSEVEPNP